MICPKEVCIFEGKDLFGMLCVLLVNVGISITIFVHLSVAYMDCTEQMAQTWQSKQTLLSSFPSKPHVARQLGIQTGAASLL